MTVRRRPRAWIRAAAIVVAAAAVAGVVSFRDPGPAGAATSAPKVTLPSAAVVFGDERKTYAQRRLRENQLDIRSGIVAMFNSWDTADFPAGRASDIRKTGAVPMLAWTSEGITLAQILSGKYDGYIDHWAQQIKTYGHPVLLRLFPELNCNWEWWAPGVHGNTRAQFPAAWRHVVGIFHRDAVPNVRWIWSTGYSCDKTYLADLWPGTAYVDFTGVDIYNWKVPTADRADRQLDSNVAAVRAVAPQLPVMLPEVGCRYYWADQGPWLREILARAPELGIRAVVYFDENREPDRPDWRLGSDDPLLPQQRALRAGVWDAVHQPSVVTAGGYTRDAIESFLMARPALRPAPGW